MHYTVAFSAPFLVEAHSSTELEVEGRGRPEGRERTQTYGTDNAGKTKEGDRTEYTTRYIILIDSDRQAA